MCKRVENIILTRDIYETFCPRRSVCKLAGLFLYDLFFFFVKNSFHFYARNRFFLGGFIGPGLFFFEDGTRTHRKSNRGKEG